MVAISGLEVFNSITRVACDYYVRPDEIAQQTNRLTKKDISGRHPSLILFDP